MLARRRTGTSDPDCAEHSGVNQRIPRFLDHLPCLLIHEKRRSAGGIYEPHALRPRSSRALRHQRMG